MKKQKLNLNQLKIVSHVFDIKIKKLQTIVGGGKNILTEKKQGATLDDMSSSMMD